WVEALHQAFAERFLVELRPAGTRGDLAPEICPFLVDCLTLRGRQWLGAGRCRLRQAAEREGLLEDRVEGRVNRCRDAVDLARGLPGWVAADDEPVVGEQLIVLLALPPLEDRLVIDLVDPRGLTTTSRTDQLDVLGIGRGDEAPGVVQGVEHRLLP